MGRRPLFHVSTKRNTEPILVVRCGSGQEIRQNQPLTRPSFSLSKNKSIDLRESHEEPCQNCVSAARSCHDASAGSSAANCYWSKFYQYASGGSTSRGSANLCEYHGRLHSGGRGSNRGSRN